MGSPRGVLFAAIGPCQPLTDQTMQSFGLSSSQTAIVATLQNFAVKPGTDLFQQGARPQSLAAPRQFAAAGAFSDDWFPDSANPGDVGLGIHLRYVKTNADPQLYQMTYTVDDSERHFTVLWNRAALNGPSRK